MKPIILVKICYKLLYVIQAVKKIFDKYLADIKVFGRTYLFTMLLLIGLALFTSRVFLFSTQCTGNTYVLGFIYLYTLYSIM